MPLTEKYILENRGMESGKGAYGSFHDFLGSVNSKLLKKGIPTIEEGGHRYNFLLNTWEESGKPFIQEYDFPMRAHFVDAKDPWGDVGRVGDERLHVSFAPDSLKIQRGSMENALDELAHAYQWTAPQSVRDSLNQAVQTQSENLGPLKYGYRNVYPLAVPAEEQPNVDLAKKYFDLPGVSAYESIDRHYGPSAKGKKSEDLDWAFYSPSYEGWEMQDPRDQIDLRDHRKMQPTIPVEYEAHSIISPAIWEDYETTEALDWMEADVDPSKAYRTNAGVLALEALEGLFNKVFVK